MSQQSHRDQVREIVADVLRVDLEEVTDGARFGEDLPAESLDYVEMAELVDVELGVEIPDDDLEDLDTVGDLAAYVEDADE